MPNYHIGQTVRVGGLLRKLKSRVNTCGDWMLALPVEGRLMFNESEFTLSDVQPVDQKRQVHSNVSLRYFTRGGTK